MDMDRGHGRRQIRRAEGPTSDPLTIRDQERQETEIRASPEGGTGSSPPSDGDGTMLGDRW